MYYTRNKILPGLGANPVVVAAAIKAGTNILNAILGKKSWNWSICDPLDRHLMAHIFNVFYMTPNSGGYDRIRFWMDKVVDASGNNLGGKYGWAPVIAAIKGGPNWLANDWMFGQMGREAYLYGSGAGLSVDQIMQIFNTEDPSIDTSGVYHPPASLVQAATAQAQGPTQTQGPSQTDAVTEAAAVTPGGISSFLPIALIGGLAFVVAKKMRVI